MHCDKCCGQSVLKSSLQVETRATFKESPQRGLRLGRFGIGITSASLANYTYNWSKVWEEAAVEVVVISGKLAVGVA